MEYFHSLSSLGTSTWEAEADRELERQVILSEFFPSNFMTAWKTALLFHK